IGERGVRSSVSPISSVIAFSRRSRTEAKTGSMGRVIRRGGPRYGPPASSSEGGYATLGLPRPSRGRAPAQPGRASGSTQDVSSAAVARRRDLQERHRAGAAERVLGQAAVPARQVLLLNEDRRQRGGHARVVRRLRVALEP